MCYCTDYIMQSIIVRIGQVIWGSVCDRSKAITGSGAFDVYAHNEIIKFYRYDDSDTIAKLKYFCALKAN